MGDYLFFSIQGNGNKCPNNPAPTTILQLSFYNIIFLSCFWIFSGISSHQLMLAYSLFWSELLKINYYPNTCTLSCSLGRRFALGLSTCSFQCLAILLRFEVKVLNKTESVRSYKVQQTFWFDLFGQNEVIPDQDAR